MRVQYGNPTSHVSWTFFAESSTFQSNQTETERNIYINIYLWIVHQHNWHTGLWLMFVVALQMSEENKWMTMDDIDGERERKSALEKKPNWYYAHQNEIKSDLPLITECDEICWYLKLDIRSVSHGKIDFFSPENSLKYWEKNECSLKWTVWNHWIIPFLHW